MNRSTFALAAALAAFAMAAPAAAAVNARQLNQQRNIDAGLRSGKLTRAEYDKLKDEQRSIERKQGQLTRDGHYSERDKAVVHAMQDTADRNIERLKHNGRRDA